MYYILSVLTELRHCGNSMSIRGDKIMSHNVRNHTFEHVCPVKIQISMHIHTFWSESSLGTFWITKGTKFLHADDEEFDQTVLMSSLAAQLSEGTFSHFNCNLYVLVQN